MKWPLKKKDIFASESSTQDLLRRLDSPDAGSRKSALKTIVELCRDDWNNLNIIAEMGLIPVIVRSTTFPNDRVVKHAVIAIQHVTIAHERNSATVGECGAIPVLMQLLKRLPAIVSLALYNLAAAERNREMILSSPDLGNLLVLVTSALQRPRDEETAMLALSRLIEGNLEASRKLAAAGLIPHIVRVLRTGSGDGKLKASNLLTSMAICHVLKDKIIQAAALPALFDIITSTLLMGANVRGEAIEAVAKLAESPLAGKKIVVAGGVSILCRALEDKNEMIRLPAVKCLCNLALVPTTHEEMGAAGLIPILVGILSQEQHRQGELSATTFTLIRGLDLLTTHNQVNAGRAVQARAITCLLAYFSEAMPLTIASRVAMIIERLSVTCKYEVARELHFSIGGNPPSSIVVINRLRPMLHLHTNEPLIRRAVVKLFLALTKAPEFNYAEDIATADCVKVFLDMLENDSHANHPDLMEILTAIACVNEEVCLTLGGLRLMELLLKFVKIEVDSIQAVIKNKEKEGNIGDPSDDMEYSRKCCEAALYAIKAFCEKTKPNQVEFVIKNGIVRLLRIMQVSQQKRQRPVISYEGLENALKILREVAVSQAMGRRRIIDGGGVSILLGLLAAADSQESAIAIPSSNAEIAISILALDIIELVLAQNPEDQRKACMDKGTARILVLTLHRLLRHRQASGNPGSIATETNSTAPSSASSVTSFGAAASSAVLPVLTVLELLARKNKDFTAAVVEAEGVTTLLEVIERGGGGYEDPRCVEKAVLVLWAIVELQTSSRRKSVGRELMILQHSDAIGGNGMMVGMHSLLALITLTSSSFGSMVASYSAMTPTSRQKQYPATTSIAESFASVGGPPHPYGMDTQVPDVPLPASVAKISDKRWLNPPRSSGRAVRKHSTPTSRGSLGAEGSRGQYQDWLSSTPPVSPSIYTPTPPLTPPPGSVCRSPQHSEPMLTGRLAITNKTKLHILRIFAELSKSPALAAALDEFGVLTVAEELVDGRVVALPNDTFLKTNADVKSHAKSIVRRIKRGKVLTGLMLKSSSSSSVIIESGRGSMGSVRTTHTETSIRASSRWSLTRRHSAAMA